MQFGIGIEYDRDGDGSVDAETEIDRLVGDRLYR